MQMIAMKFGMLVIGLVENAVSIDGLAHTKKNAFWGEPYCLIQIYKFTTAAQVFSHLFLRLSKVTLGVSSFVVQVNFNSKKRTTVTMASR